ncbi:hypothetical protein ACG04R_26515 [Roseateles sp. BYS78W]|uniref:Uncharacterized protein n=1 Tax=Pelomonas candidula TaxID=3299025 RepID=A0ABW7HKF4_9BURK
MHALEEPDQTLDRVSFEIRLVVFLAIGFALSTGARAALALLAVKAVSGHWPIWLFFIAEVIGGLWLITLAVVNAYVFVKRAALPRLSDIGFYGSVRRWITVLLFLFPVSVLVVLCMLLMPGGYVPRK